MRWRVKMLAVVMFCLAGLRSAHPQSIEGGLASAKTLKCFFSVMTAGTWTKDGTPHADVVSAQFSLQFDQIDTQDGTGHVVGFTGGPSDIIVRLSSRNLHLLAIDAAGALYITTVFPKESHPGKLRAVHTRHEYADVQLPGFTSSPEQYYGECEVGR